MLKLFLKPSVAVCAFVVVTLFQAQSALAAQTLPFYEPFPISYVEGTRLGSGTSSVVWELGNGTGSGSATNTATAALEFIGLATSGESMGILLLETPGSNRDRGVEFNPAQTLGAANPALYVSFLLNVQTPPSGTRRVAYFRNSTSSGNNNAAVFLNTSSQLQLAKSGDTPEAATTSPLGAGTHLVVMRYRWISASSGDDEVALWLDPQSLGGEEGSAPIPTISINAGSDAADLQAFFISQRTADASGTLFVDEIRIATNWAGVTPSSGPPHDPFVTETSTIPGGLVFAGTNGPPNGAYLVLRSSDAGLPLYQWTVIAANHFDTKGNFACTNPISTSDIQMFYRLVVGSEPPPVPTAPSITMQPTNLTVTVGQDATFVVMANGTPPLHYQWYFNTNTPLLYSNTNAITVANAHDTNAGTYSVIITNIAGVTNSGFAVLTVNPAPIKPFFTMQPTNQTVSAGDFVTLIGKADGTDPLHYQWFFNTNTPLVNETNSSLEFSSAHATNQGAYSVRVTNIAGSVTSSNAMLTVLSKPFIVTQPQSKTVTESNDITLSVEAVGTPPFYYQWYFDTNTILDDETNAFLFIANAQSNYAGSYSVVLSNSYGSVTGLIAVLTINPPVTNDARFDLVGFGQDTTGGGVIPETDPAYVKAYTPLDLANAIRSANKTAGSVKVIEIMNDLDLGWNEIGSAAQNLDSNPYRPPSNEPLLHPRLLTTGVSIVDIKSKSGLTIFSANGATIRHANFNIKDTSNIIVRNLKFDELWEWDESSKGDYDRNDYDFITIGNGGGTVSNVWVDHCTFTKSYDGICDMKGGCFNLTFSWNKYTGDDGATNPNSWVWQQINSLESNKTSYAMYNFLRTHGFSTTNIVTIIQGHDKTHLMGANSLDSENDQLSATFHHQWYINPWDRLPRLRAGNVHNFNIYVDDTVGLAAKRLRDTIASAMSASDQNTLNNTYSFNPFLNGTISTENGAILVEKSVYFDCLTPLRNNQTDPSNPTYTGKIMALDSIYHFDNADTTTIDYRGSSTNAPGDTYFGPVQAPTIPFSWNLPGNQVPYSYTMDDPAQLESIVTDPNTGAGAGVLNWAKTNWLKTSY